MGSITLAIRAMFHAVCTGGLPAVLSFQRNIQYFAENLAACAAQPLAEERETLDSLVLVFSQLHQLLWILYVLVTPCGIKDSAAWHRDREPKLGARPMPLGMVF